MDAPVWTNSFCNKLVHISRDWGKHVVTDTIDFILQQYRPKERRTNYVRSVCDIRPHKTETRITRLTEVVYLIDYPGEVITPTS